MRLQSPGWVAHDLESQGMTAVAIERVAGSGQWDASGPFAPVSSARSTSGIEAFDPKQSSDRMTRPDMRLQSIGWVPHDLESQGITAVAIKRVSRNHTLGCASAAS